RRRQPKDRGGLGGAELSAQQRRRSCHSEPHARPSQVGSRISTGRTRRGAWRRGGRSTQAGSSTAVGRLRGGEVTVSGARPLRNYDLRGRPRADADEAHDDEAHHQDSEQNPRPVAGGQSPAPSRGSRRGLDWFVFFLADAQMGFGPLVAVYLTTQKWTQGDIGLVLTAGGLVALVGQMPGGALVDAARSERVLAAFSVVAIGASALMIGAWPIFAVVLAAK